MIRFRISHLPTQTSMEVRGEHLPRIGEWVEFYDKESRKLSGTVAVVLHSFGSPISSNKPGEQIGIPNVRIK